MECNYQTRQHARYFDLIFIIHMRAFQKLPAKSFNGSFVVISQHSMVALLLFVGIVNMVSIMIVIAYDFNQYEN